MFKKPLGNLKPAAPLHDLDRRKFKQRVVAAFGVSQDEADQLVPEGIQSIKFSSYLNKQGVAYLGPDGDPLWFTIGKGSDELIPTIYTLWKERDLVPCVSTSPSVIRVLVGGADHAVIQRPTQSIVKDRLVSICQYDHKEEHPTLSAPLIIGRMAISSDHMTEGGKEKAVIVLHAWKDHLWDMGSKLDVPEPTMIAEATQEHTSHTTTRASHTPQKVTDILHNSLLQSISTIFSSLPVSDFPIPSTQFYTNHILPCRPATTPKDVTIKNSTHKSLTTFLKAAEKAFLLTLKSLQKQKGLLVMSVNKTHSSVLGHVNYETVKDAEEKNAKRKEIEKEAELGASLLGKPHLESTKEKALKMAKRDEMENEGGKKPELGVRLLWKPHTESTYLFESIGGDPNTLYTVQEIKTLLDSYISSRNLVDTKDQAHINLDDLLRKCVYAKRESKQAMAGDEDENLLESRLIKREELVKKVIAKMQDWYEIVKDGETFLKEGTLKPIQVQVITDAGQGRIKYKTKRGRIKVIQKKVVTKARPSTLKPIPATKARHSTLKPIPVVTKAGHNRKGTLKPIQVGTKARRDRTGTLKPIQVGTKARRDRKAILKPIQVDTKAGQDTLKSNQVDPKAGQDRIPPKVHYWYKIMRTRRTSQKKRKSTLRPEGRKASTYITGFEPFLTVEAEAMADELRVMCASATSVSPFSWEGEWMKVMVQGKQSKAVLEFLTSNGVPKQWIELVDK